MAKTKPSLPRGTRDFGPHVSAKRAYIINKIKANFIKYGFSQIETPSMENLSVLTGKYGDEGDQLIFKILNSGDFLSKTSKEDFENGSTQLLPKIAEKGLRYDLTVPFARFVVMNQNEISFPFKRYQIQPVWRADRPQKGRYREFYQCDADIIGSKGIWSEIELTLLLTDVFSDLNFSDYVIKVNHRELLFLLADYTSLGNNPIAFCTELDKLDKIGAEKVLDNLISLGGRKQKLDEILSLFSKPTSSEDLLEILKKIDPENEGLAQLEEYLSSIYRLNSEVKVELDASLARGLSYYTGMIYEVKPTSVKMGSICGGGRYDNLTGQFGLKGVSGIGISFGLDRIYDVLEELNLFPSNIEQSLDVLVVHFNYNTMMHGQEIVYQLRKNGIRSDLYPEVAKIRKQFDFADKIDAPYTIIIGDDEMKERKYMLKDMASGDQKPLGIDKIISLLKG